MCVMTTVITGSSSSAVMSQLLQTTLIAVWIEWIHFRRTYETEQNTGSKYNVDSTSM